MTTKNVLTLSLAFMSLFAANIANAGFAADIQNSFLVARAEALAVGGYIVGSIVSLMIVTLVLYMLRRSY
ncbi:MAG: hypothetical protein ACH34X_08825 [Thiolinea sp.]